MATRVDMYLDQGAEYKHRFLYRDRDTKLAVDISGYALSMQVRPYAESDDVLWDADNAGKGGILITDGPNGELLITIPAATSSAWRNDEAVYNIMGTPSGGEPDRIAEGNLFISKNTTR